MDFFTRHRPGPAVLSVLLAAMAGPALAQVPARTATHPNGEVSLMAEFEVKPGFETEFETAFSRSSKCARLDPGNAAFVVHKVTGTTDRYIVYNIWRTADAFKRHLERPYTKALFVMQKRALVRPLSDGGLRFISDLDPAARTAPRRGDPSDDADCR